MRKHFQNADVFSFLSGIVISLACTVLYEGITEINSLCILQLIIMMFSSALMVLSTILLMSLSYEIKDLSMRFEQLKNMKMRIQNEDSSITLGIMANLNDELWKRVLRWRADDDIMENTGELPNDQVANRYIGKLTRKLDCFFYLSIIFFILSLVFLVVVQFI